MKAALSLGHRERLKKRFLNHPESLQDYELIELLLFYAIPRKDVRSLAKSLLKEAGNVRNLLAHIPTLVSSPDSPIKVTSNTAVLLRLVPEIAKHLLKAELHGKPIISSWMQLLDYCFLTLSAEKYEKMLVMYLNTKNCIIKEEVIAEGNLDAVGTDLSYLIRRAIECGAASLLLAHNHPSGHLQPSKADIDVTKKLEKMARVLNLHVYDHLLVSHKGVYSFREHHLL